MSRQLDKTDLRAKKLEVLALHDQGLSKLKISKLCGLSRTTVTKWIQQGTESGQQAEIVVEKDGVAPVKTTSLANIKKRMENTLDRVALEGFELARENLDNASPYHQALIGSIAFDKARLMRGESTQNHAHLIGSLAEGDLD